VLQRSAQFNAQHTDTLLEYDTPSCSNLDLESFLAQAIKRGLDKGIAHLTAVNLLAMAEQLLDLSATLTQTNRNCTPTSPAEIWRLITDSEVLATRNRHQYNANTNTNTTTTTTNNNHHAEGTMMAINGTHANDSRQALQAAKLLRSQCWSLYGHSDLGMPSNPTHQSCTRALY
jgi:hypothetical protein